MSGWSDGKGVCLVGLKAGIPKHGRLCVLGNLTDGSAGYSFNELAHRGLRLRALQGISIGVNGGRQPSPWARQQSNKRLKPTALAFDR